MLCVNQFEFLLEIVRIRLCLLRNYFWVYSWQWQWI